MGTMRSLGSLAIVAVVAAGGCSTGPKETNVSGAPVTARQNNSKTEQSYLAADSSNEVAMRSSEGDTSGASSVTADVSEAADAGDVSTSPEDDTKSTDTDTTTSLTELGASQPAAAEPSGAQQVTDPMTDLACRETAGQCDPTGACALSDCDFDRSGKSCAYTPERTHPFMCVRTTDYEPYRPCDADDVCAPGSVCVSKAALLADGSFYRRSTPVCRPTCRIDADCGENEWCADATNENNEVIADLRVCHRHCSTESDCYVGEGDEEVRCSNSVQGAPRSQYECSRYRPPLSVPDDGATDVAPSTADPNTTADDSEATSSTVAPLATSLALSALRLQAPAAECLFPEDCPSSFECIENICRPSCEKDEDCDRAECVVVDGLGVCGAPCHKPEGAACGLLPFNCGCATGESCNLGRDFQPTCAAPGRNEVMTWCNESTDCDTGLSCIGGLCRPLCHPEEHPCAPSLGECVLSVSREGDDIYACAGSCDPVTAPQCGHGALCLPGFDSAHHQRALCVAENAAQSPKSQGESCATDYDCATGLGCDSAAVCQPWCRDDADCDDGTECKFETSIMGPSLQRFGNAADDVIGLCAPSET